MNDILKTKAMHSLIDEKFNKSEVISMLMGALNVIYKDKDRSIIDFLDHMRKKMDK